MNTATKQAQFVMTVNRKTFRGSCIAECVEAYNDWKDAHDFGASKIGALFPIRQDGVYIGDISYNGRFWAGGYGKAA